MAYFPKFSHPSLTKGQATRKEWDSFMSYFLFILTSILVLSLFTFYYILYIFGSLKFLWFPQVVWSLLPILVALSLSWQETLIGLDFGYPPRALPIKFRAGSAIPSSLFPIVPCQFSLTHSIICGPYSLLSSPLTHENPAIPTTCI